MNPTRLLLVASAAMFALVSCQTKNSMETYSEAIAKLEKEAAGAVFPRVISPGWRVMGDGKPSMDVSGFSNVSYVKEGAPDDIVDIFYHGKKDHRIITDDPSTVTIMGKTVQTYGSGNENVAFATQRLLLTAPNGKSAYYSFQFNNKNLYESRKIPEFGW